MKIRIEVDKGIKENEVIIRCNELNDQVMLIQKQLTNVLSDKNSILLYKGEKECYIPLEELLFFETEENGVCGHTEREVYQVKYKLYELEELLPNNFIRASKSTIVNVNQIYSITRNLTASSLVEFKNTHKTVYISRNYYKAVSMKLKEKRNV